MKNNEQQQNLSTRLSNAKLLTLLEHLMMFINEDGSPVDGFRFREVTIGIKAALQSTPPVSQPVEEQSLRAFLLDVENDLTSIDDEHDLGQLVFDVARRIRKKLSTPHPLDGEKGDGGEGKEN
jgi:hypothetical protein